MPIEIREFEVVATISSDPERHDNSTVTPDRVEILKKEIIAESVESVFSIIQNQKDR